MSRLIELANKSRGKWKYVAATGAVLVMLAFTRHILHSAVEAGVSILVLGLLSALIFLVIQFLPYVMQVLDRVQADAQLREVQHNPEHELHAQRQMRHEALLQQERSHGELVVQAEKMHRAIETARERAPGHDLSDLHMQHANLRRHCEASFERLLRARAEAQRFDAEVHIITAKLKAAEAGKRAFAAARPAPKESIMQGRKLEGARDAVQVAMAEMEASAALIEADYAIHPRLHEKG